MIVTPRRFSAEVLRRGFRTSKGDLYQNLSATVRHHKSVKYFLSAVVALRCSQSMLQCLYSQPKKIAVQTKVDKHVRNIRNRSSTCALVLAHKSRTRVHGARPSSSLNVDVSSSLQQRRSTIPHLRAQSHQLYSLEAKSTVEKKCLVAMSLQLVCSCRFR